MHARLSLFLFVSLLLLGCSPNVSFEIVEFLQEGRGDVRLNESLILRFSLAVDPLSVGATSLALVDESGKSPRGKWGVVGRELRFKPALPMRADLADTGLASRTTYRVVVAGFPAHGAILSACGRSLAGRQEFTFTTIGRGAVDGAPLIDSSPNGAPRLLSVNRTRLNEIAMQGVIIPKEGGIVIEFSEALLPASVLEGSPCLHVVSDEGRSKTIPLACSFVDGSENRKVALRPLEPLDAQSRYQLRNESLEFTDFAGNRIDGTNFDHVEFRSCP